MSQTPAGDRQSSTDALNASSGAKQSMDVLRGKRRLSLTEVTVNKNMCANLVAAIPEEIESYTLRESRRRRLGEAGSDRASFSACVDFLSEFERVFPNESRVESSPQRSSQNCLTSPNDVTLPVFSMAREGE